MSDSEMLVRSANNQCVDMRAVNACSLSLYERSDVVTQQINLIH